MTKFTTSYRINDDPNSWTRIRTTVNVLAILPTGHDQIYNQLSSQRRPYLLNEIPYYC